MTESEKAAKSAYDLMARRSQHPAAVRAREEHRQELLERMVISAMAGAWNYGDTDAGLKRVLRLCRLMVDEMIPEEKLTESQCEDNDLSARNAGAESAARKLWEIATTGKHTGVFGSKVMEEAAQAILSCRSNASEDAANHDKMVRMEALTDASRVANLVGSSALANLNACGDKETSRIQMQTAGQIANSILALLEV